MRDEKETRLQGMEKKSTDLKQQGEEDQTGSNKEEARFDTSEEEENTEASEQSESDDQREGNEVMSREKKELTGRTDLDDIDDENQPNTFEIKEVENEENKAEANPKVRPKEDDVNPKDLEKDDNKEGGVDCRGPCSKGNWSDRKSTGTEEDESNQLEKKEDTEAVHPGEVGDDEVISGVDPTAKDQANVDN